MTDNAGVTEKRKTRAILIASGKGGVGKSTAAIYLARALTQAGRRVLLIDADTGIGCLDALLLGEPAETGWYEAAMEYCGWDAAVNTSPEGVDLLAAPKTAPDQEDGALIASAIRRMRGAYDFILVDAPAGIDGAMTGCASGCDSAIVVATPDAVSVRGARAAASALEKAGIAPEKIRLLINRFVKKQAVRARLLDIDGVIDRTGVRLLGILPEDGRIPVSSVTGKLPKEGGAFRLACERVAKRIQGEQIPLSFRKMK